MPGHSPRAAAPAAAYPAATPSGYAPAGPGYGPAGPGYGPGYGPGASYTPAYGLVGGRAVWGGAAPVPGMAPAPGTYIPGSYGPVAWEYATVGSLTSGADTVTVTAGSTPQVVYALEGNDRLTLTGNGAVFVIAGDGDDTVIADGTATLAAYEIEGGNGADLIDLSRLTIGAKASGGLGADTIIGGSGNDTLDGGAKPHESGGGFYLDSADIIRGGAGDDRIKGGDGADQLYGDSGADNVSGGGGDDLIVGGAGADRLSGGWGADRFAFAAGDAAITTDAYGAITIDSIADVQSNDVLSLGFTVRSVLNTGTAVFYDFESARAAASSLMAATSGTGEVVVVAAGRDTVLFFSSTGGDVADSAIRLDNVFPDVVTTSLFG